MCLHAPQVARALACAAALLALLLAPPVMAKPTTMPAAGLPHVARRIAHAQPLRIVAFGSSSTEGAGASSPDATYPSRLRVFLREALHAPVEVINAGVGGEDADDMARRVADVIALRPDLVIWQTGSNDPLRGVPLDRFVAETRAGIAAFRAAGLDVMLMEPQDCDVLRETPGAFAYRDALRRLAAEMQVPLVRRYDLMRAWLAQGLLTRAELFADDGLHMTDGGYARLAEAVGRQILDLCGRGRHQLAGGGR
jgi:acyl-CoA thioesterase-1